MLTVWGRANSSNVQKAMWAVGELGLAHERIDVGMAFGGNDQAWYLAMNPNGRVPTIDDDGFVLFESNVIVRYLAARYGRSTLWPEDDRTRALADRWMDWQQTTLIGPMTTVFWNLVRTPEGQRDMAAVARDAKVLEALFGQLDGWLAERPYIAGERFSMGDIPVGTLTYRWYNLDIARPSLPHVEAWYHRLKERSAYRAHVMLPVT